MSELPIGSIVFNNYPAPAIKPELGSVGNMVTIPCDKLKEMQAEIAALTAKLAESEKQLADWKSTAEQHKENYDIINGYLRLQLAEAMKDALEKAAKVCEDFKWEHRAGAFNTELDRCAEAIRAMKDE